MSVSDSPESAERVPIVGSATVRYCTPAQLQQLRGLLRATGRQEVEILRHYHLHALEDLSAAMAERLIQRLKDIEAEQGD